MSDDAYPPIGEHAFLSDCHTGALVGPTGSVDWLAAPRFDSPTVFARVLDSDKGGSWQFQVEGAGKPTRRYLDSTMVLESRWQGPDGVAVGHDFLAVKPTGSAGPDGIVPEGALVRLLRCEQGSVEVASSVDCRPGYGGRRAEWSGEGDTLTGTNCDLWLSCAPRGRVVVDNDGIGLRANLNAGDAVTLAMGYRGDLHRKIDRPTAERLLVSTIDAWRGWQSRSDYSGFGAEQVHRSALVLRGLMFDESGALIAAPTTSLPEWIGGGRNWDYRFAWHRDAALLVLALLRLGHQQEAGRYLRFLIDNCSHGKSELEPVLALDGSTEFPERELSHLDGYRGSKPVRVGNEASDQVQLDGYGQILDAALAYHEVTGDLSRGEMGHLRALVDMLCERWREPDHGKWEIRDDRRHWTHSKLYAWVCLDRGVRLAEMFGDSDASLDRWARERNQVRKEILEQGYDEELKAFTQSYGSKNVDASVLRMPLVGFLDGDDPRVLSTLDRIEADLGVGGHLIRRYDVEDTQDGVGGPEGAFVLSSFEFVSALVLAGRTEQARSRFDAICRHSGEFGLYAEEMLEDGTMLGNYPQAFSHLALIDAALNLNRADRRDALHDWADERSRQG